MDVYASDRTKRMAGEQMRNAMGIEETHTSKKVTLSRTIATYDNIMLG